MGDSDKALKFYQLVLRNDPDQVRKLQIYDFHANVQMYVCSSCTYWACVRTFVVLTLYEAEM